MIETYRGVVYPIHMDHMGHMNVQHYVARFDEATWHLCSRLGLTSDYFRESGNGMAAVRQTIEYVREAHAGNLLVIQSSVEKVDQKALHLHHEMNNAETGEVLANASMIGVHFNRESRRACALPNSVGELGKELFDASEIE